MILRRRLETPKFRMIILIRVFLRRYQKLLKTLLVMMPLPRSRTIPRARMIILVRGVLKAPKPRMMVLVRGVLRRCQRLLVVLFEIHGLGWSGWNNLMASLDPAASVRALRSNKVAGARKTGHLVKVLK
jgi:hypothetical protein